MWNPSAIRPYIAPRLRPLTTAEATIIPVPRETISRPSSAPAPTIRSQSLLASVHERKDLSALEVREQVVARSERVLVLGRKRLLVRLDQPIIGVDAVERHADFGALGAAGLGDGKGGQVHRVVGVGDADGRGHVSQRFDLGI